MKKLFILGIVVALTGCTGYSQTNANAYLSDASSFNGGIPQTQDVGALQKRVVTSGLQNEIAKNNADTQHAMIGVASARAGLENQIENNRHNATMGRINEVWGVLGPAASITNMFVH